MAVIPTFAPNGVCHRWLTTAQGESLDFNHVLSYQAIWSPTTIRVPSAHGRFSSRIAPSAIQARRLWQDQRIRRAGMGLAEAALGDTSVSIDRWSLVRQEASYVPKSKRRFLVRSDAHADAGPIAQWRGRDEPQGTWRSGGQLLL